MEKNYYFTGNEDVSHLLPYAGAGILSSFSTLEDAIPFLKMTTQEFDSLLREIQSGD